MPKNIRSVSYFTRAVLAAGLALASSWAQPLLHGLEIGQGNDTGAVSATYKMPSVRIGAGFEGSASSAGYRLELSPPPASNGTTPPDVTPPLVVITGPLADTLVNVSSLPVKYSVDGTAGFVKTFSLVEGLNRLVVDSTDAAGNRGADTVSVTLDSQAPAVVITKPSVDTLVKSPSFTVQYSVDGVAGFAKVFVLAEGPNQLVVDSMDAAGNRGADTVAVILDTHAPVVLITAPLHGSQTNQSVVNVDWTVDGMLQTEQVVAVLDDGDNVITRSATDLAGNTGTASVTVRMDAIAPVVAILYPGRDTLVSSASMTLAYIVDGIGFSKLFTLLPGPNLLRVDSTDLAGNTGKDEVVVTLDAQGPILTVQPAHLQVFSELLVPLKIKYSDSVAGLAPGSFQVLLDGQDITSTFTIGADSAVAILSTSEGVHHLSISLEDILGNSATLESDFTCTLPPPALTLTSPLDLATVRTADILVQGESQGTLTQLRVDGIAATLTGNHFQALVPLTDGKNTILATAFNAGGTQVSATLTVTLDREKPRIYITSPIEGMVVRGNAIAVTGSVSDRITDAQGQSMPDVKVNGVDAVVTNNTFLATVPLTIGPNTLTAVATDKAGNLESAVAHVTRDESAVPALAVFSGQNQSANVYSALSQPLKVLVKNASGQPVSGSSVLFRVTVGDGSFSGGARILLAQTGADGLASAAFTLGKRAGPGSNEVTASAEGFSGEAVFHPDALVQPAHRIHPASGDMQRGIAGNQAPQALVAIVTDSASNPVPGAIVEFKVKAGGGHFDGRNADSAVTGEDGRAVASFTLGPQEGRDNNLVEANFAGNPSQAAVFVLSGYLPGDPADTKISGVILDNSNRPLQGVTVRIEENGQQTSTDVQGQFLLSGTPVGDLHLHVDGTTASQSGDWVTLMFEVNAISGKNNDIGMPLYLVARNNAEGKPASASQAQVITLSQIPGFALTVPAGSATFPQDMDDHTVTVTSVHTDKIPMPPGEGMQPRFIISIGPPQVKFDPPAPITYPNVDGLKPGEQTHFYSFDHDLGTFVSIGTGTVSEDGATITSDKGFGIVKGGWHCAGPGNPTGSAANPKVIINLNFPKVICQNQSINFSAVCSPIPGTMNWDAAGGAPSTSGGNSFLTSFGTSGTKTIVAKWKCLSGVEISDSQTLTVANLADISVSGATPFGSTGSGVYTVAKGAGNASLTAILNPAVAAGNLPANFINWSNGQAGNDQLGRLVSLGAATDVTVTAQTCNVPKTARIYVRDVCTSNSSIAITSNPTRNSGAATNDARPRMPTIDWDVCSGASDGKWHVRVKKVEATGQINIRPWPSAPSSMTVPNTANPVNGGNINNVIGSKNRWFFAISDMSDYNHAGGGAGPSWHSTAASTAHEEHHWNVDWMVTCMNHGNWNQTETDLENLQVDVSAYLTDADAKAALKAQVDARFGTFTTDVINHWNNAIAPADAPGGGGGAYAAGAAVLSGLIQNVQSFRSANGW